jgi:S-DNA-T family DNA segregation ATPase FtsK/SpoIIIE
VKERRFNEIKGVILIAIGLIILASLVSFTVFDLAFYTSHPNIPAKNLISTFGAYLAGACLFLFGWASYFIPLLVLFLGIKLFKHEKLDLRLIRILGIVLFLISISSIIGLASDKDQIVSFSHGGALGFISARFVNAYFGKLGGYIIFITLALLSFALVTEMLISVVVRFFSEKFKNILFGNFNALAKNKVKVKFDVNRASANSEKQAKEDKKLKFQLKTAGQPVVIKENNLTSSLAAKPNIQIKSKPQESQIKVRQEEVKIGGYVLPGLDLLESPPPPEERQLKEDLQENARILEDTLNDFGIQVKVTDIERGPVITRYELEPAPGMKLNRIVALNDDISLAMKAPSVRIVAPIPGKARVGIEVPNSQGSIVYLKEVFVHEQFQHAKYKLPVVFGKDISGHPVIADLSDMPHLLIAGTTGSGKTVCVNSLILSLLYKLAPHELKLVMVDPKMVELAAYNGLPHLMCPVVTDAKKASAALGWIVGEMEDRYQLLAKEGTRNIESYNQKKDPAPGMPYIVVIIDELADLMMVSRDQIESAITRLAQLSRAVGIHLVLATQRPSVDVVTGVIKANFPARVSFKVASKVDSRTVLDMNGADKLLGKGDMLFLKPGEEKLTRAQGSLVKDKEIEKVIGFISAQAKPVYNEAILKEQQRSNMMGDQRDELFDDAVRIVMETNQASASIIQRRLRLGYTRAARILDMMEAEGIVGPFEGSKARQILINREEWIKQSVMNNSSGVKETEAENG